MAAAASATFSIALATCDGASFLPSQLQSYLDQDSPADELVVGDDASDDATIVLLETFAKRAPFPVSIVQNSTRLGFNGNFLSVMARCSGDYVAFSDQDDVWRRDKISRCRSIAAQHPTVALIRHTARLVDAWGTAGGGSFPRRGSSRIAPPLTTDPWTPAIA